MRASETKNPIMLLILVVGLMVPALPALADTGDEITEDVRVKVIKCEDGDCEEMAGDVDENIEVVLGDDAKKIVVRKVRCDGEDCEEHARAHKMVFVGEDGDVEVMAGDKGHKWIRHHGGLMAGGGYLGVGLTELTPELREHFGVPADEGVMVSKVMDDSPAARAGLRAGDIIAGVDGETVANGMALAGAVRGREAGDAVLLDVWRDGAPTALTATIEEREALGMHGPHHGMGPKMMKKIVVECDSDDGDCKSNAEVAGLDEFDCGGSAECEVEVECKDGGCTCTVNGEDADCSDIPGVPGR